MEMSCSNDKTDATLTGAEIGGIVVGVVLVLGLAAAMLYFKVVKLSRLAKPGSSPEDVTKTLLSAD